MKYSESENCWEFWGNKKICEKCQVKKLGFGKECWMISKPENRTPYCPKMKQSFKHCWKCPFFKKLNPEIK